ncbi:MAG: hypothetical protein AAF662_05505 [Pseudomonadota bacterium]
MRIQAPPFFLKDPDDAASAKSARTQRLSNNLSENAFTEDWLQDLIHQNPELVPASDIEPVFSDLAAVCREMSCAAGFIDNVFVSPSGYLVFVECKLWRNTEARRKVIAQILDYAKDIAAWQFDDLSAAVNAANGTKLENPLYECIKDHPEAPDEITFVDRVSRNLRTGRHLLLIVGDGIQENLVDLVQHVQGHMGLHFILSLVELGVFRLEDQGGFVIVPNIIAKTELVERGVLRIEADHAVAIEEPVAPSKSTSSSGRAAPFSEQEFFAEIAKRSPRGPDFLRALITALEPLGVYYEIKRSFILKISPDGEQEFGLGYFEKSGRFASAHVTWNLKELGHVSIARDYLVALAELTGGEVPEHENPGDWSVQVDGRLLNIEDLLDKQEAFVRILRAFIGELRKLVSD